MNSATVASMPERQIKRRTQAERSQETRERIIRAAIEILRQNGFAGLRVANVAKEAGVSRGAQTHHFSSKKDLVLAVFDTLFGHSAEASRQRIANIRPDDDIFQLMIVDASEFFLGPDFAMGLDLLGSAEHDPELRDGVRNIAKEVRTTVEDMWVGLLLSRGLARDDAEDILWLIFGAIRGLSLRMLWQFDARRFERLKKITYDAACQLYKERRKSGMANMLARRKTR